MTYENPAATALLDRQIVESSFAGIDVHLQQQAESIWEASRQKHDQYIEDLFEQYAPEVPERQRLIARRIGATGLSYLTERYGPDEYHPKIYSGSYEQQVLAAYHHAGHSVGFIENAFKYAWIINKRRPGTYTPDHFMRFPIIGAYHDPIMGNGRGNDERQSALLGSEMYTRLWPSLTPDKAIYEGIRATTWDPKRQQQAIDKTRPAIKYQLAAGVADLLPLFDKRGPYQSMCNAVEDMTKQAQGQILTKAARAMGISLVGVNIETCMDIIDASDSLHAAYGRIIRGQVAFFAGFKSADPGLDELFTGRPANISLFNSLSTAYDAGRIGAQQMLDIARDYRHLDD